MSEEIDITEHDLLENPKLRNIFSDLTVLKKEIGDACYEELQEQSTSNISNRPDESITYIKEELEKAPDLTKDSFQSDVVKKSLLHSNIIVFGNKCSKTRENKLKYRVEINIKDISHYLKKSQSYCWVCKILFAKKDMYEKHKTLNHQGTFRINEESTILNQENIVSNNKDSLSGRKNVTRDGQINISEENQTKKCSHCKNIFSTQKQLIEHIYEVLDKKANMQKRNSKKHCEIKNSVNKNSQPFDNNANEKSKDNAEYEMKVHTTSLTKTKLMNESTLENEPLSGSHNLTEVVCGTSQNEALQCTICLYYFKHRRLYEVHMKRRHKTSMKQIKVVKFNPKCILCSKSYPTITSFNSHLRCAHSTLISDSYEKTNSEEPHANEETRTGNSNNSLTLGQQNTTTLCLESSYDLINDRPLIFKRVLFKCLQCEIHFLSSKLATSHIVHSEILVNWKCSVCKIFFKRSDEDLHMKQHIYTDSFTVLNVEDKDSSRMMIKCAKCPLHIPESDVRQHLNVCGENINTWHCLVCNIDIHGNSKNIKAHNAVHDVINGQNSDFIFINDSLLSPQIEIDDMIKSQQVQDTLITGEKIIKKQKRKVENINKKQKGEVKKVIKKRKRKVSATSNAELRKKLIELCSANDDHYAKFIFQPSDTPLFLLNLTYCKNCECFINFFYRLEVHLENRCHNLSKRVCNYCGIVFTPKLIQRHKALHKVNPHLKLQDFRFYDIETCEQILPPLPIYPKCDRCEAHFLSNVDIRNHACAETENWCCDICQLKFASEQTLNLHIPFHGYYLQSKFSPNNFRDIDLNLYSKSVIEEPVIESSNKEDQIKNKICENEMDVDEPQINEGYEAYADPTEKQISLSQENYTNDKREHIKDVHYLYTCEICNVSVGHYDHLIEHCHSHYNNSNKNIVTEKCNECDLMFELCSMTSHKEMHESGIRSESFVILTCDLFYFGRSNAEWLNHVFKSVPESKRENILKLAIYKDEYRIKLDVAQEGDPDFTLYLCTKCTIFIEQSDIMVDHRKKCMGTKRKYPCHHCGIALLSQTQRARHLKLHERHTVSANSYRIVVFNRIKDKSLNDVLLKESVKCAPKGLCSGK